MSSSAQRMRKRMGVDLDFRKKESQRISNLQKKQRESMNETQLKELRKKNREKVAAWRLKQKDKNKLKLSITSSGFKTPQSKGKAIRKLVDVLPVSPRKRVSAVCGLADRICLSLINKLDDNLNPVIVNPNL
ncbi:hypothetical protein SNE40_016512 [Patella caerulea]|uniref:Uncharacterized protein n=1 Tax=Patella caerulea TaxID=87958 RepID=A0AAN8PNN8_PATCE